jgi:hypothetical protein
VCACALATDSEALVSLCTKRQQEKLSLSSDQVLRPRDKKDVWLMSERSCSVCSLAVLPSRQDFAHVIQSYSPCCAIGKVTSTRNPFHIEQNFKARVTFLHFILFYFFPRFSRCISPCLLLSHFFPSYSFLVSFFLSLYSLNVLSVLKWILER